MQSVFKQAIIYKYKHFNYWNTTPWGFSVSNNKTITLTVKITYQPCTHESFKCFHLLPHPKPFTGIVTTKRFFLFSLSTTQEFEANRTTPLYKATKKILLITINQQPLSVKKIEMVANL